MSLLCVCVCVEKVSTVIDLFSHPYDLINRGINQLTIAVFVFLLPKATYKIELPRALTSS